MTQDERKKIEEREDTERYMFAYFCLFILVQIVAMFIALDHRGYGNVVAWIIISFIPLSLSIGAWWRLGKMRE